MNARVMALVALAALAACPASRARADEAAPRMTEPTSRWYGWEVLACDLASSSLIYAGRRSEWLAPTIVGVGGYVAAPGYVHHANGHSARGYVSVGVRAAVPLLGAALGARSDGWLVGLGASAMLFDTVVLSWSRVEPAPAPSLSPMALAAPQGALIGLQGAF